LSILGINMKSQLKQLRKTILVYLVLSAAALVVSKVYGIFGHGVDSPAMTWMFLYPLLGGALFYFVIVWFIPGTIKISGYRVFFNSYNSGIAVLTFGSFLKGILEIAGTSSPYTVLFYEAGVLFIASGLILLFVLVMNLKKIQP
jgi:hypothetical protein